MKIYTIGHGTKSEFELSRILKKHNIKILVDVRSVPFSKYNPQFNRFSIAKHLESDGIQYVWKGKNLGGKYGKEGNQDYQENIDWLIEQGKIDNICIMCSESNYKTCHRHQMIEPDLFKSGEDVEIHHINWSGNDTSYKKREVLGVIKQQSLF